MVKSPWAVMATASPRCSVPVRVPGGNPVTEAAGQIPMSPVTLVGPMLVTAGVAARMPKLQAAPKGMGLPGGVQVREVVKDHTKLAASPVPEALVAPVVMVAVYNVVGERAPEGVKVATLVEAT